MGTVEVSSMATILLVDDDEAIRNILTKVLKKDGFEVISYEDAAPAIKAVDFESINLVITDLLMPTPGEELIHEIRSQGKQVPIIVLTGGSLYDINEEDLKQFGVDEILRKPIIFDELLAVIRELLGES